MSENWSVGEPEFNDKERDAMSGSYDWALSQYRNYTGDTWEPEKGFNLMPNISGAKTFTMFKSPDAEESYFLINDSAKQAIPLRGTGEKDSPFKSLNADYIRIIKYFAECRAIQQQQSVFMHVPDIKYYISEAISLLGVEVKPGLYECKFTADTSILEWIYCDEEQ